MIFQKLGDAHNFGQFVRLTPGGLLEKPRSTLWEWLLTGEDSPLRACLNRKAALQNVASPFDSIPVIHFQRRSERHALIEPLSWRPFKPGDLAALTAPDWASAGSAIALFFWLGISDLHYQNVAFGWSSRCRLLLCPLDVETIFEDLTFLGQTNLVPLARGGTTLRHNGLQVAASRVELDHVAALLHGFLESTELLAAIHSELASVILSIPGVESAPIRILLRKSQDYLRRDRDFYREERIQLRRGDVPYFYKTLSDPRPRYYSSKNGKSRLAAISSLLAPDRMAGGRSNLEVLRSRSSGAELFFWCAVRDVLGFLPSATGGMRGRYKRVLLRRNGPVWSVSASGLRIREIPCEPGALT